MKKFNKEKIIEELGTIKIACYCNNIGNMFIMKMINNKIIIIYSCDNLLFTIEPKEDYNLFDYLLSNRDILNDCGIEYKTEEGNVLYIKL